MKKKTCTIITFNKYKQLYAFVQELYGAAVPRFLSHAAAKPHQLPEHFATI